ncbi:futalosine hydrolase [Flaviaesturariibacter amylovorans]|uniref:Futalosine hydrolase n=1 Tax=Flaviaesturariibacter amylovorans TaxID=1084520 RepID=A0ABP8H486_9BACT
MPRLLLCAATPFEIAPVADALPRFGGDVEVLITGVGLMETAFSLAARLGGNPPALLLQAGLAGCFDPGRELGHTCLVSHDCIGDQGVWEAGSFRSTFALRFSDPSRAPWADGWLANESEVLRKLKLPLVKAVSVNQVTTAPEQARYYYKELGADAESMEGAAFHYAALRSGLPFVQLRAFSNYVGERDKTRWKLRESISHLNETLLDLIPNLLS